MYILGINSAYHESSACLIKDGKILMAVEEERYNRIKHGKKPTADNADELPINAIQACLKSAGLRHDQIMHVGYAFNPSRIWENTVPQQQSEWHADVYDDALWTREYELRFVENMSQITDKMADMGFTGKFQWVDHHAAHAASAFYPSSFSDAAVLSIDGIGDINSTAFYEGRQHSLKLLQEVYMPNSLGLLWELVSMFLGFSIYDAYKTMGLAAYGNPERYAGKFRQIIRIVPDGKFETNDAVLHYRALDYINHSGYYSPTTIHDEING